MIVRSTPTPVVVPREAAYDRRLSHRAFRLLVTLMAHEGADGVVRRYLAEGLGCSEDSVDRAVRELVECGYLDVVPTTNEHGGRTTNDYVVRV